ncbi:uncharacterized protein LOC118203163 [Stegodyphus dumicola]|uniref:uncharacterized protein LOC118203163 n=1 Tax=Stegodyphus dumicola TaxID=202533 RepID=UPI0015ABF7C3|nr:uncharacterized protein LOC118203163 [Stegodyphus dumicola]
MPPSSGSEESSSPRKLSPFVFWAQTQNKISLRISLHDVSTPVINTTKDGMEFFAHGVGANEGRNEYYFKFVFFKHVNPVSITEIFISIFNLYSWVENQLL